MNSPVPQAVEGREPWLVIIDHQRIFADPSSAWCASAFEDTIPPIRELVDAFPGRTLVTRWLPEPDRTGSWGPYFEQWSFADEPDESPLFELVGLARELVDQGLAQVVDARTFGKFGPQLLAITGPQPHLVLAGVATDCCVVSTALAAADGGALVEVVAAACAGSTPENHQKALDIMALYGPQVLVR